MNNLQKHFFKFVGHRSYSSLYKSSIALQHLYPNSNLKLTTPKPLSNDQQFTGYIPLDQLDITYSKSGGPGGQNINKVNTKVEVRFNLKEATWINNDLKTKLVEKLKNKVTKDGFIIFRSDVTRSQQMNLADCLNKIRTSIRNCITEVVEPSAETEEIMRRRVDRATRERLAVKKIRSQVKQHRQHPDITL